ncbi:hypothetical protein Hanom_Chr04g00308931 [Helianthus anomalus]
MSLLRWQMPIYLTKILFLLQNHQTMQSVFRQVAKRKSKADNKVKEAEQELASKIAEVDYLKEELKKAMKEKTICEAKLAAAQAEKDICDNAYNEFEYMVKNK